ncbi:class E sortase [Myceligenerans sp. I2]|uniref:Class E sortase n=1 Tax=Myceligenerans indicum TaxID=2593663 RepID=A0ABS1LR49_9MICO|nr:class E sortase [Myceligenerans indicum]
MVAGVVGVFGELLVTVGVLLGLFVVWQLWWTDVEGARTQQQIVADMGWEEPAATDNGPQTAVATEHRDAPPVLDEPAAIGETFAQMYVPRWGSDYLKPIAEGTDKATVLDTIGIGHYVGTEMPGALGNFATAAHRTTYGKPYNKIHELKKQDALVVRTEDTWYVYKVTDSKIVLPQNIEVISTVPGVKPGEPMPEPTQRFITLTTCHPMFSAAQRYIVHGELDYWAPVSEGTPKELLEEQG